MSQSTYTPIARSDRRRVIILGTGGTIAGSGADLGYAAGTVAVEELLVHVTPPTDVDLTAEQVAQLDSKDMDFETWHALWQRCVHWLAQPDVVGVVITHGTDTIEETAFLLSCVVDAVRPIVLTCAMRPATSRAPDGPQNLRDAVAVATDPGAGGVVVVCAGEVHGARHVRKVEPYRLNAFGSGDVGPVGFIEEGWVRLTRPWPSPTPMTAAERANLPADPASWPRVEIVVSHAGARGDLIDALVRERTAGRPDAVAGIVLAATGNGTLHRSIEAAAARARAAGIAVLIASRCANGRVIREAGASLPDAGDLSPVKARVMLMLQLINGRAAGSERQDHT